MKTQSGSHRFQNVAFRAQVDMTEEHYAGNIGTLSKKQRSMIDTNTTELQFEDEELEFVLSKRKER